MSRSKHLKASLTHLRNIRPYIRRRVADMDDY